MPAHKTSAWPLAQAYVALVVYASLYPFDGWRLQGIPPWEFLWSAWPRYWTGFDVTANVTGYAPLGFLLALALLRRPGPAGTPSLGRTSALLLATAGGSGLSLCMEALQTYLPVRVPSNLDFGLNALGTLAGAWLAVALERLGAIDRWTRFRERWFVLDSRGALVLLALWPLALLFPASVPLGLGQVMERMEAALGEWLMDTPFLEWLPLRDVELQPMVPGAELISVALGVLVPCLLAYSVVPAIGRRLAMALLVLVVGVFATTLSTTLTWSPLHAWAWLTLPVQLGLALGWVLALVLAPLPARGCAALVMLAVVVHLSLLNQAPAGAYFSQTLQTWEQGRFIRFHGLAQWLGWLWPFGVVMYVLLRLSRSERRT